MKKKYRIPGVALFALLACFSCSDDGDGNGNSGDISFYGETYSLSQGAIYHDNNHTVIAVEDYVFEDHWQDDQGSHVDTLQGFTAEVQQEQTGNFLIGLYEDTFIVSDLTQDARGQGACVCFRIASPEVDRIVPGKYTFSPNKSAYTFKGNSAVNYNSDGTILPNEFAEGELLISQEGEIYTINFNCKAAYTGGTIKGSYTGTLKTYDIRKTLENVNFYQDIKLEALFDKVDYIDADGVSHSEPDYLRGACFLTSKTQKVCSANEYRNYAEVDKKDIDIALAYDREKQEIYFESPLKARTLLWHNTYKDETLDNYTFDLPCHTQYMPAPADFTNADFEALEKQEDFLFDFTETATRIPVDTPTPYFVFVQTGNGLKGVIRIREITPESTESILDVEYPVNPAIMMDVKFPKNFSEQTMR